MKRGNNSIIILLILTLPLIGLSQTNIDEDFDYLGNHFDQFSLNEAGNSDWSGLGYRYIEVADITNQLHFEPFRNTPVFNKIIEGNTDLQMKPDLLKIELKTNHKSEGRYKIESLFYAGSELIGTAILENESSKIWKEFTLPVDYNTTGTPDKMYFRVSSLNSSGKANAARVWIKNIQITQTKTYNYQFTDNLP